MSFTFLHTSDWHIGKPFGRFPAEQAAILRRARLLAIDRLADAALSGGAAHVLVAGDVFDRPGISDLDLRAPLEQMRAHPALTWHVIPGNHDPAVSGGAWERAMRAGLPANVRLHLEPRAIEIASGVLLLPAPLFSKATSTDPTAWMDTAATSEGVLRIGLAHGSVQGFGGEQQASIQIAPDRARRAGLSYLALGDWHGHLAIGNATAYSGTPEPDGYLDNAAGHALLVTLDGPGAAPHVSRKDTAQHRWHQHRIEASRTTDIAALEGTVEGWGALARNALLAVEARGRASPAEDHAIRQRLDRLETRIFHLDRKLDALTIVAGDTDLEALEDGPIRDIARELSAIASRVSEEGSGGNGDGAVAARALRHLFELADPPASRLEGEAA